MYDFAPGQTVYMEDWKAKHFAKHLTNREMFKRGAEDFYSPLYESLFDKCFTAMEQAAQAVTGELSKIETELLNLNQVAVKKLEEQEKKEAQTENKIAEPEQKQEKTPFCDLCDSKGVRHKKVCPKYVPFA